jgi:hypothetical protein
MVRSQELRNEVVVLLLHCLQYTVSCVPADTPSSFPLNTDAGRPFPVRDIHATVHSLLADLPVAIPRTWPKQ